MWLTPVLPNCDKRLGQIIQNTNNQMKKYTTSLIIRVKLKQDLSLFMKHENNKNESLGQNVARTLKTHIFWPINSPLRTLCEGRNSSCPQDVSIKWKKCVWSIFSTTG